MGLKELEARFGAVLAAAGEDAGPSAQGAYLPARDRRPCFEVPTDRIHDVLSYLLTESSPRYEQLASLTATDELVPEESEPGRPVLRPGARKRFRLVYHARSVSGAESGEPEVIRLVAWIDDG
ncbi:MAG: NADH-quinone oxidoreductase subunit C, partial [Planctomycetota bacterium]